MRQSVNFGYTKISLLKTFVCVFFVIEVCLESVKSSSNLNQGWKEDKTTSQNNFLSEESVNISRPLKKTIFFSKKENLPRKTLPFQDRQILTQDENDTFAFYEELQSQQIFGKKGSFFNQERWGEVNPDNIDDFEEVSSIFSLDADEAEINGTQNFDGISRGQRWKDVSLNFQDLFSDQTLRNISYKLTCELNTSSKRELIEEVKNETRCFIILIKECVLNKLGSVMANIKVTCNESSSINSILDISNSTHTDKITQM